MNIFTEIEGLRGENLSSALLRLILLRSQDARLKFAGLLTDLTLHSFGVRRRFSCTSEVGTSDPVRGGGRLDLMLEMDDALVGIENKFDANFQQDQPQKYLATLADQAEQLAKGGFIKANRYVLVVLAPRSRHADIQARIRDLSPQERKHCHFLAWEDVLDALVPLAATQDPKSRELIGEFEGYVRQYLTQSIYERSSTWLATLTRWTTYGSERHQEAVRQLWWLFKDVGAANRISNGETWLGYYFRVRDPGWFGFVDASLIKEGRSAPATYHEAEFVVVLGFDAPDPDRAIFKPIRMGMENWCGAPEKKAWVVDLPKLTSESKWREALAPILRAAAAQGVPSDLPALTTVPAY